MPKRSPFPGMDPYLEATWGDVHGKLAFLAADALQRQLGGELVARSGQRVVVELPGERLRSIVPDVHVVDRGDSGSVSGGAVAVAAPLVFGVDDEPTRQAFIEIRDVATDGRVVTVIEFTSPSNKREGDGRSQYRRKQAECRAAGVNLVEVDLTRAGKRNLLVSRWPESSYHRTAYAVSVWRATESSRCALYPIRLPDRLPTIRIPLRATDADVSLDLQALVDRAYESGAYGLTIDYARPPEPPLSDADAAWVATLLPTIT